MTGNEQNLLKLLAFLLEYPTPSWRDELVHLSDLSGMTAENGSGEAIAAFLAYAGTRSLIELQEVYTASFDLDPATSLNLTYHLMGDHENRGKALAGLLQIYRQAGYDASARELPDFLPLMLEFLALCPEPEAAEILRASIGTVAPLAKRLQAAGHPYAPIIRLAAEIIQPLCDAGSEVMHEEI
jgi:nitrate reductase delta subunit